MNKLLITLLPLLLISNLASAKPIYQVTELNSLSKAVLELVATTPSSTVSEKEATSYSHESEKNNSLARGALAIQGVKANLVFNSKSKISDSHATSTREQNNSLWHGVLAKQSKNWPKHMH